jgi:hypothetical protein
MHRVPGGCAQYAVPASQPLAQSVTGSACSDGAEPSGAHATPLLVAFVVLVSSMWDEAGVWIWHAPASTVKSVVHAPPVDTLIVFGQLHDPEGVQEQAHAPGARRAFANQDVPEKSPDGHAPPSSSTTYGDQPSGKPPSSRPRHERSIERHAGGSGASRTTSGAPVSMTPMSAMPVSTPPSSVP